MLNHSANLQLGLFAIGCAPGGGNSNFWTILLGGNIDLSVTMTFVSNFVALGNRIESKIYSMNFGSSNDYQIVFSNDAILAIHFG